MSDRAPAPRRVAHRRRQILGVGLIGYGAIGIVLFVFVALAISRPLVRAQRLSESAETQRVALAATLDEAAAAIEQMSAAIGRMDGSLGEAKTATQRGSDIANGLATSMFELRDAVSLSIFGAQPLIGLAPGFGNTGQQLQLLGENMTAIGGALEINRGDAVTTSADMVLLADSVTGLARGLEDTPSVSISATTLNNVLLVVYAVAGWMVVLAAGCVLGGLYLVVNGRSRNV